MTEQQHELLNKYEEGLRDALTKHLTEKKALDGRLLEIEELNAIQWTPGVGEPQGGDKKWYDLYRRIKAGGKSVEANWVTLDELEPLLDNVGAEGMLLSMDFKNEHEIDEALKIVDRYR